MTTHQSTEQRSLTNARRRERMRQLENDAAQVRYAPRVLAAADVVVRPATDAERAEFVAVEFMGLTLAARRVGEGE